MADDQIPGPMFDEICASMAEDYVVRKEMTAMGLGEQIDRAGSIPTTPPLTERQVQYAVQKIFAALDRYGVDLATVQIDMAPIPTHVKFAHIATQRVVLSIEDRDVS